MPTVSVNLSEEDERELNIRLNKNTAEWDIDLLSNFDVVDLKEWGFKDIELGFNIDKIDEDKPITITVKEDDAVLANELYEDLKGKGYKVTIK